MRITRNYAMTAALAAALTLPLTAQNQPATNAPSQSNPADQYKGATGSTSDASQQHRAGEAMSGNTQNGQAATGNQQSRPTNPGFGAQVPNEALSGNTPQTNSTYQATQNGNQGFDLGWLGLLGLFGLLGFRRGSNAETREHNSEVVGSHSPSVMNRG